jgi:hypothetical protein
VAASADGWSAGVDCFGELPEQAYKPIAMPSIKIIFFIPIILIVLPHKITQQQKGAV